MATVSISPSPNIAMMSNRRAPLSNNPNGVNSPFRSVVTTAGKRSRSYSSVQRELPYGQPPPTKKQIIETDQQALRTPPRQQIYLHVPTQRTANQHQTAVERKPTHTRERQIQQKLSKIDKTSRENLETIRQWQRHYRRVFPEFVFYFESIPEELRLKCSRQVVSLGAREEKFFSAEVTHVVTTRPIPPEIDPGSSTDTAGPSSVATVSQRNRVRTINPSLLERSSESAVSQAHYQPPKAKFTFDAPLGRKAANHGRLDTISNIGGGQDESKKQIGRNADVLSRAREYGMKIWALEKLQRMMATMFDTGTTLAPQHGHNTRSNATGTVAVASKQSRNEDLSNLLRNERLHGPLDRDPTVASKDLIEFKAVFIYVRDMKEKYRPIMVREYPAVKTREEGQWPQFRSVSHGKCPFVEEVVHTRRDHDRARMRAREDASKQRKEAQNVPRTRAVTTVDMATNEDPKRILVEIENSASRTSVSTQVAPVAKMFVPPKLVPAKRDSPANHMNGSQNEHASYASSRYFGGEPVASGVQPSNITSAIRSQMISSTSAAPGVKAGTSKEIYGLQRKVLERTSQTSRNGVPRSFRVADFTNVAVTDAMATGQRGTKRKPEEKLERLDEEDSSLSDEEEEEEGTSQRRQAATVPRGAGRSRVQVEDPKPGYCENCREKFDDFDQHTQQRKHRKFAMEAKNWQDLDAVLAKLGRPLKME